MITLLRPYKQIGGKSLELSTNFSELGIIHRLACPHTHHQNGVVERKHRHVVVLGLTLSHATGSLKFFVPCTVLTCQTRTYKHLKAFGCACFPFLRPYNSHKLDFRSHECLFLGYSTNHKGYKCLSPSGKVFVSKDVVFNETRFPYSDVFSKPSSPSSPPSSSSFSANIPLADPAPFIPIPTTIRSSSTSSQNNVFNSPSPPQTFTTIRSF